MTFFYTCADCFEALGTPSASTSFDDEFANCISNQVRNIFRLCLEDPLGVLNEPPAYEEVADVCSRLKMGVSGVSKDYEHICHVCPPIWKLLFQLYQQFL